MAKLPCRTDETTFTDPADIDDRAVGDDNKGSHQALGMSDSGPGLYEATPQKRWLLGSRWRQGLLEAAAWIILAGCVAHGDFSRLTDSIPAGQEPFATVAVFNAWTVGWNAKSLKQGFADYWHAPIFFPERGTFVLSEPQPTTLIVAPLAGVIDSLALAYNVYLLLLLTANAMIGRRLLLQLGYASLLSWCGGAMFLTLPFVVWQLGVLQLTAVCGPLSLIWAVLRFSKEATVRRGAACGVAFAFAYAACNHYGLFLTLLAPVLLILLGRLLGRASTWARLLLAVGVAGLLLAPLLWAQNTWLHEHGHARSLELMERLSARSESYLRTYVTRFRPMSLEPLGRDGVEPVFPLGLGSLTYAAAAIGAVGGMVRGDKRTWTLFCLVLACCAYLLSLGPLWKPWGIAPFEWLQGWYPGLSMLRSPHRFAVMLQIALVCLAVEGLDVASLCVACRFREIAQRFVASAATSGMLAAAMLWQTLPPAPRLFPLPDVQRNSGWIEWLRSQTPTDSAVLCLPLPISRRVADAQAAAEWMYLGLWHERAMVNGYSGFFPEHHQVVKSILSRFPDEGSLLLFQQWGIDYVIVREQALLEGLSLEAMGGRLRRVYRDVEAGVSVYRLD